MQSSAVRLFAALIYFIGTAPRDTNGYLLNTWSSQDLAVLGASVYGSKCHPIPANLTLCYGIGYDQMRLPNHLNHDTMSEAIDQSENWLPLIRTNCHDDLRVFLCSMYAPVCLADATRVKPCRSLCKGVRRSCLPRMQAVGYVWPDILRCDQFPQGDQLCVPPRQNQKAACTPCRQSATYENIISSHCMAPIVFKGRINRYVDNANRLDIVLHRKKKFYKAGGLSRAARRNLDAYITKSRGCTCSPVASARPQEKWLIMGRRENSQVKITFLVSWQRRNRAFKRAVRDIRRRKNICQYKAGGKRQESRRNQRKKKKRRRKNKRSGRRRKNGRGRRRGRNRQSAGNSTRTFPTPPVIGGNGARNLNTTTSGSGRRARPRPNNRRRGRE